MKLRANLAVILALALAAAIVAGCGGSDSSEETGAEAGKADLAPVKTYLTDHSADLEEQVGLLKEKSDEYYGLAKSVDFDYDRLLKEHGDEVAEVLADSKDIFVVANPAYEQMEGIVAGVPRLAHYDVDIDAGSDASTPEDAVSFNLETPDGKTLKQPGNLFFLTETALYGTNPDLLAKGVEGDVDGSGKVEFGEGLPDANIYKATLDEFDKQAKELNEDAQEFEPTSSDALTSIVIMTPTMSEYFEAWKNSRFIAGEGASEQGFVATSRLSDIADILGGILVTYNGMEPEIASANKQQATQTKKELESLVAFAADLRDREVDGEKFTAKQADALGAQAQSQAEAIAGQVTQAANELGVELQEG
ncbi:MAG TPA: hypothetical protein VHR18_02930 [Solirubrobacterales bacterium]|jgi:hypothetical protein|nr:hypothetical protein [Solirubrobacterales bacterium]